MQILGPRPERVARLEPGEQFELIVSYTAVSPEQDVGNLIFGSNATVGDTQITLIGNADSPCIRLAGDAIVEDPETGEQTIDFGVGLVGRTIQKKSGS